MKVLFFNQSMMNTVEAFGIDLINNNELDAALGYQEMAYAAKLGAGIHEKAKLARLGLVSDFKGTIIRDIESEMVDAGIYDGQRLTRLLNVIATKTGNLIFYIGEEQTSPTPCMILMALGQIMSADEVIKTEVWSHYCKNS